MHLICADLGSYSVKIIHSKIERSNVRHLSMHEFVLADYHQEDVVIHDVEELKIKILKDYLNGVTDEYKLILQAPHNSVSFRVLRLPIRSKKKAYQMIPFQLEEQIPFTLSEVQYSAQLHVGKKESVAQVAFIRKTEFEAIHQKFKDFKVTPQIQTSESSLFAQMATRPSMDLPAAFCILDMGHDATRAYFFVGQELVSHHICFVGGKSINEEISENYNINEDEAVIYKHQNAFVLTEDQYGSADESQRHFGKMMDHVFSQLVIDFKRWELGFKVGHARPMNEIFITGGTSNIKNMENFLTEKLGTKTFKLDTFRDVSAEKLDRDPKVRTRYNIANLMALGYLKKQNLVNFLTGEYSLTGQTDLPLHSFGFYLVRVAAISFIFILSLLTEKFLLYRDLKTIDARLINIVKNPVLGIPPMDRRNVNRTPERVLGILSRKDRFIKQEISTLQAAVEVNGLLTLKELASLIQDTKASLEQYNSNDNENFIAVFTAEDIEELKKLQSAVQGSKLSDATMSLNEADKTLTINRGGE